MAEDAAEFSLQDAQKQYDEIIIAVAADFDALAQTTAFQLVKQRALSDMRFNAPVRQELEPSDEIDAESDRRRGAAIELMPFTTISEPEQVAILLDLVAARSENTRSAEHRSAVSGAAGVFTRASGLGRLITSRLSLLRRPLADELATRLAAENPPAIYYHLAALTGRDGRALIPMLLSAAGSDDRAVKSAAFLAAGRVLDAQTSAADELEDAAKQVNVSAKSLEYARRIINRADRDGDGVLTRDEWREMLVDPSAADRDGDGKITAEEYAAWIESRTRP